jgi:hypothetical protein
MIDDAKITPVQSTPDTDQTSVTVVPGTNTTDADPENSAVEEPVEPESDDSEADEADSEDETTGAMTAA